MWQYIRVLKKYIVTRKKKNYTITLNENYVYEKKTDNEISVKKNLKQ